MQSRQSEIIAEQPQAASAEPMGHLPKVATCDLVTQISVALVTLCLPAVWMIECLPGGECYNTPVGLSFTIAGTAAAVLSVTSPFWMQLRPLLVKFLIYLIASCATCVGFMLMFLELKEWRGIPILGHICQCGVAIIIGQNVEKSPERTAAFDDSRWVHMLIGGALAVVGSIIAISQHKLFELLEEFDDPGNKIGGVVSYVAFGVMLAFPLWHRHENPLVRGGVASVASLLIGLIPLLAFADVAMFYPVTMPGQIIACYALGGYQGEAMRQMMIDKARSQDGQQHDDPEQPAKQPLAASAEPIEGIDAPSP